ncbi:MAG TPA: 5'-nucleotidase C-terminal domain-containing protein [Gaiellaceae bacterium]|nr:5'-nucleotidase C-terminal domain-containing protein [Gaiellaceae bacterium]
MASLVLGMLVIAGPAAAGNGHGNGPKPKKDNDTHVQLLAINDFHGNLAPPSGSSGRISVGPGQTVDAGGAEYLSTHIKQLRDRNSNTITVGAGDLIGASPLLSGLFHDEPTIEAMNAMGIDVSSVGNHEFDEGIDELLRMQNGGCHPVDGCQDGTPFGGALFQYLAANVVRDSGGENPLPPYEVEKIGNAKIAFIGLTLQGTPLIVTPSGVAGLTFLPEAATINSLVEQLRRDQGVRSFVVLIHQGGQQNAPYANGFQDVNRCDNFTGDIAPIVEALDPQVDLVVSAHTHQPYICEINGIPVTSASSFGRLITDIDLVIDHQTKDVKSVEAHNVIVTRDVPKDPAITKIIDHYTEFEQPIANRVVGSITEDITKSQNDAGESALGDVIADAQLEATAPSDFGGAVVAFMNPGGIRADLTYNPLTNGQVTYNDLFTVQPFANTMAVETLTGAQIYAVLEEQWAGSNATTFPKVLQVSDGFTYTWDANAPLGSRVVPGSAAIDGVAVDPLASYRVAMNNFLQTGGDGFSTFTQGTDLLGGDIDVDTAVAYFQAHSPVAPGPQNRITRLN